MSETKESDENLSVFCDYLVIIPQEFMQSYQTFHIIILRRRVIERNVMVVVAKRVEYLF